MSEASPIVETVHLRREFDSLRALMLQNGVSGFGLWIDAAIEAGAFLLLLAIATHKYPTLAQ